VHLIVPRFADAFGRRGFRLSIIPRCDDLNLSHRKRPSAAKLSSATRVIPP
jgi:hypothetical protein